MFHFDDFQYLALTLAMATQLALVFLVSGNRVLAMASEAGALIKPWQFVFKVIYKNYLGEKIQSFNTPAVIKWSGGTPNPIYAWKFSDCK